MLYGVLRRDNDNNMTGYFIVPLIDLLKRGVPACKIFTFVSPFFSVISPPNLPPPPPLFFLPSPIIATP